MTTVNRTLILLRHAKSSWEDDSLDDFDRPLNPRGRRDAPRMGKWLRENAPRPDAVLCSSAARTRETWAGVSGQLADPPDATFLDPLYDASPDVILSAAQSLSDSVRTALIIGHNPGIEQAMRELAAKERLGEESSEKELRRMRKKVPTGAVAMFRWDGEWADLGPETANLERFVRPKDLK